MWSYRRRSEKAGFFLFLVMCLYCHGNQFISSCLPHYVRCDQTVTEVGHNIAIEDRIRILGSNILLSTLF
jgi:hypothetical protein